MGLMSTLGTVLDIGKILYDSDKSTEEIAEQLLKAQQRADMLSIDGDITRLMQQVLVEPCIIVSKSLKDYEYMDDILAFQTDMFCSYYMQAFDMLTGLYGIKGVAAIKILGTDNGGIGMLVNAGLKAGLQAGANQPIDVQTHYVEEMPSLFDKLTNKNYSLLTGVALHSEAPSSHMVFDNPKLLKDDPKLAYQREKDVREFNHKVAVDTAKNANDMTKNQIEREKHQFNVRTTNRRLQRDEMATRKVIAESISRYDKLDKLKDDIMYKTLQRTFKISIAVENGNMVDNNGNRINSGERHIDIPIVIKSFVLYVDPADIVNMIEPESKDYNFFSRLDDYKSGAISFRELMFCSDLVSKYKKNRLRDKEGILKLLQSRKVSANTKAAVYNMVGFEKSYNMLILDNNDKPTLQAAIRGDFINNEKYKQDLLEAAHGMTVGIVNKDYERYMLATKSIRGTANLDVKKIAKKENSKSDDIIELFKAMQLNRTPTF